MEIHSIHDVAKLLGTAEVAEQYDIETANVLEACKAGRFSEDEAVLTSIGWLITPEGAARLWPRRSTIEHILAERLTGATWSAGDLLQAAERAILPLIGTERKRHCVIRQVSAIKLRVEFKDKTLAIYSDAPAGEAFHVAHVAPLQPTTIYTCPRGCADEVYRETYDTPYEAEARIRSFDHEPGWAKTTEEAGDLQTLGEHVIFD